jgi:transcriptional regulator with XRE-family HTH domain
MKHPKKKASKHISAGVHPSDNALAFADLGRKLTFTKIARRIGKTEAAARHYATGRRVPDELTQLRIHEAYGLPLAGWLPAEDAPGRAEARIGELTREVKDDRGPLGRPSKGVPEQNALSRLEKLKADGITSRKDAAECEKIAESGGLLARYRRLAVTLEGALERASKDNDATARDVSAVAQALSRCLQHIGRLTGEGEITEAMIVKAPAFGRVLDVIREVGGRHRDAAREIFEGLSKLGGAS